MAWYYVHCIVKRPNHEDPYTRIQEYGVSTNVMLGEGRERWSEDKMIGVLERKEHVVKAYGNKPGSTEKEYVELEVVSRNGKKYVKTKNDGDKPDNLLEQRECEARDTR